MVSVFQCFSACPETSVACPDYSGFQCLPRNLGGLPRELGGFSACPENSVVSVPAPKPRWFQCFSVSVPAPRTRWFQCLPRLLGVSVPAPRPRWLNDKYHSPRIYSWVEFGSRDTPHLEPDFTYNFYSVCDNKRFHNTSNISDQRSIISHQRSPFSINLLKINKSLALWVNIQYIYQQAVITPKALYYGLSCL